MRFRRFTLLELVTAMAVVLTVLAIALAGFTRLRLEHSPREQVENLQRLAAICRRVAMAQGTTQDVSWDAGEREIRFGRECIRLSDGLTLIVDQEEVTGSRELLRFYPDGNASECIVELTCDDERAGLRVSPLTGVMEVYEIE